MSINGAKTELAVKALDAAMTIAKSRKRGFTHRTVLRAFDPIYDRLLAASGLNVEPNQVQIIFSGQRTEDGQQELAS